MVWWYNYRLRNSRSNILDSRAVQEQDIIQDDVVNQNNNSQREIISSWEIEQYNEELSDATLKMKALESIQSWVNNEVILVKWNFDKQDPIHRAKWEVQVKQVWNDILISFSQDFTVPDGPDLYVMLSKGATVKEIRKLDNLQLWPLVRKKWSQTYKVTQNERNTHSWSLNIRCRAFDAYFSVAKFENN